MALYAPQVRQIQPAFEYNANGGTVKIYCSFSPYDSEKNDRYFRCYVTDPNQSTLDGNNSMVKASTGYVTKTPNGGFISISLTELKAFVPSQFYHVQLRTVCGNDVSEPSTVSLIRPIESQPVTFDPIDTSILGIESVFTVSGSVPSENIVNYEISITQGDNLIFTTGIISNDLGRKFATTVNCNLENGEYLLKFKGYSQYDFEMTKEEELVVNAATASQWSFTKSPSVVAKRDIGAIEVTIPAEGFEPYTGDLSILRSDNRSNYETWKRVFYATINEGKSHMYRDFDVEHNVAYRYKLLYATPTNGTYQYTFNVPVEIEFEDIFLASKKGQYAVKYNPNISGYKKVVQESITNTLGGKYPIIRKNGDTGYRQFSLSGTIYADCPEEPAGYDSRGNSLSQWVDSEVPFIYGEGIAQPKAYENYIRPDMDYRKKNEVYNRYFRQMIIDFLEDGEFKIFRSPTEGNMLVHLSNVSFTPNKTLGREIYDFSATVTECGALNQETLERYGVNLKPRVYTLHVNGTISDGVLNVGASEIQGHSLFLYLEEV